VSDLKKIDTPCIATIPLQSIKHQDISINLRNFLKWLLPQSKWWVGVLEQYIVGRKY